MAPARLLSNFALWAVASPGGDAMLLIGGSGAPLSGRWYRSRRRGWRWRRRARIVSGVSPEIGGRRPPRGAWRLLHRVHVLPAISTAWRPPQRSGHPVPAAV